LAEDDLDARQIWDEMSLGLAEGPRNNSFVEELSFKCIDDDYRDIP